MPGTQRLIAAVAILHTLGRMAILRYTKLDLVTLPLKATARQAIQSLNTSRKGIVLVVEEKNRLLGTITDGDIRRTLLDKLSLDLTLEEILARKKDIANSVPVIANLWDGAEKCLQLMRQYQVQQIPLLDRDGFVVDLVTLQDLDKASIYSPSRAVIMAGGTGTRLLPLTEKTPKPMLPIGNRPMLEHIISQLREAGVRQVHLATHYLSEQIADHFRQGEQHDVRIDYLKEPVPLGTAGSLRLLDRPQETLLVINGDILTTLDYRAMLTYHKKHQADLSIAVRLYDVEVPYGVVKLEETSVIGLVEKPTYTFAVNAGIYCIEPTVCELIPAGSRFDMNELVEALIKKGRTVVSFPIHEYWVDIGQPDEYARAQRDFAEGKFFTM
jgi:dTDP-glucose pyrophosphorylase/CBS domain-containing protein